ncbi:GxGYxYP domain-containing protein, partial [Thermodesulfobacteriota bacterium]
MMKRSLLLFAILFIPLAAVACDSSKGPQTDTDGDDGLIVFPKSPAPSHLVVYDARAHSLDMQYLLVSLQGVVNRDDPRIYLRTSPYGPGDTADHEDFWLEEMAGHFGITHEFAASPEDLMDRFGGEITGIIVTDPDMPHTLNPAAMLAAQKDGIVAAPELLDWLTAWDLPVHDDLRGVWETNEDLYRWAFDNLWPGCTREMLAYSWPGTPMSLDYWIAKKVFIIGLNLHIADERALLEEIYAATPQNIPVFGWVVDELLGVILLSQYGKFLDASDHSPNLSVRSGLAPLPLPALAEPPAVELENRIYLAFGYTDGDNISYINRNMLNQWQDPDRGSIPLGWELNVAIHDLAPEQLNYYYRTATPNDCFIGPPCGIGYMYPNLYPEDRMDEFLHISDVYYKRCGYRSAWLINDDLTFSDELACRYQEAMDLDGIFFDYWDNMDKGWYAASCGIPVARSQYIYLIGPDQIPWILDDARLAKTWLYPD